VLVLFSLLATLTTGEPGEVPVFAARNHHCQAKQNASNFSWLNPAMEFPVWKFNGDEQPGRIWLPPK
jgi:hypothetical protein